MTLLRYLLFPFACMYGAATWLRNKIYDLGLAKSKHFDIPIICIGNLSTGGTGKTPHVIYMTKWLSDVSKVAILSRGYGRSTRGYFEVDKNGSPSDYGDEPLELKLNLPNILIVVCEDRVAGVERMILEHPDIELILMDDGFQHRTISAGFNIILTSYNSNFLNDHLLPVGSLRESRSGISRADMVILTKVPDDVAAEDLELNRSKIIDACHIPTFSSMIRYRDLHPVFQGSLPMYSLENVIRCVLITGIGNPDPMVMHLKKNVEILEHIKWPDHHEPSLGDLKKARQIFDNFVGLEHIIITTEKDAVRLRSSLNKSVIQDLPIYYLKMNVHLLEEDDFKQIISNYIGENRTNS